MTSLTHDTVLISIPKPQDEAWIAKVKTKYPGISIRWLQRDGYSFQNADGSPKTEELTPEILDGVTILCLSGNPRSVEHMTSVRFLQLCTAGADVWAGTDVFGREGVVLCTCNGVHSTQIAEWAIGTWLMAQHHFLDYAVAMKSGTWLPYNAHNVIDSPGRRMGILGYGAIGRQIARLATALGMTVFAYTRSPRTTLESRHDDSYLAAPGTGDPEGLLPAKWFHGADKTSVNTFLAQDLDCLVVSLPLTKETEYLLDDEQFEILSRGSDSNGHSGLKKTYVINIARGKIIRTEALIRALKSNLISGAALDVTDPEPLPQDHPLWKTKNLFITPHVSWLTPHYFQRAMDIFEINLERLAKGEKMMNVVNTQHYR